MSGIKNFSLFFSILLFAFLTMSCATAQSVEDSLHGSGLGAEIHGAPHDLGHYVATVRDPHDFFKFEFFTLLTENEELRATFKTLKRHDKVRIWGEISAEVNSQQRHLMVSNIVVEVPADRLPLDHERQADFPATFPNSDTPFHALVHAIDRDKKILVLEYKDAVLPVQVSPLATLPDLYKNDIVEVKARIAQHPENPKHLRLSSLVPVGSLVSIHETALERTGALILFPKSPQVKFDVFAVQENLEGGLSRQYTIVNFESPELFEKVRLKLKDLWDKGDQSKIYNGRNKLINPSIQVKIKGKGNMVDRGQANPQIIVSNLDDISLTPPATAAKAAASAAQ